MTDIIEKSLPENYTKILEATRKIGFTMASDLQTGSLLKTLAASKRKSKFLELGTGTGLATAWILEGMDDASTLISVDFDESLMTIARTHLGKDDRLTLEVLDGGDWISRNKDQKFDYIFADTWHGKYLMLEETLNMLNPGGFYIIDDLIAQPNWPDGHQAKADLLINYLEDRADLVLTRQVWSTGLIVAVKR